MRSAVRSGHIIGCLRLCFANFPLPHSGFYYSCKVKKLFWYLKIQYRGWAGESSRREDPAHRAPPTHEAHGFYHDAARRVATSSEKRENSL